MFLELLKEDRRVRDKVGGDMGNGIPDYMCFERLSNSGDIHCESCLEFLYNFFVDNLVQPSQCFRYLNLDYQSKTNDSIFMG